MTSKRMVVVEDCEFGGLGLKFKDQHKFCNGMFTAQDGLIVAHDMFWAIEEAADLCTRGIEYAGQEFVLTYDRQGATMREDYPTNEY